MSPAAYLAAARDRIERMREDPASVAGLPEVVVPPGAPIGTGPAGASEVEWE